MPFQAAYLMYRDLSRLLLLCLTKVLGPSKGSSADMVAGHVAFCGALPVPFSDVVRVWTLF